jgi:toxin ParE1/3/4
LLSIGSYTLRTWGEAQTIRYFDALEPSCQMLADNSGAGRVCDYARPGLYRKEQGKHVIFFRPEPDGIRVSRILHERMLPRRHLFDDAD